MAQQQDNKGGEALTKALGPLLDKLKNDIINDLKPTIVATGHTIELKVDNLEKQIQVISGVVGNQKKPINRAKVETATATATVTNDTPIPQPVGNKKTFPANKLIYFGDRYKEDEEFRKKYVTPEIRKLMDEDTTCKSKTKHDQKVIAEGRFCWNYIKANQEEVFKELGAAYLAAKKAHEETNMAPQQNAEPHTPDGSS